MYSTGNSTQYSAITYMEKASNKNRYIYIYIYIYISDSFCCTPKTNTAL